MMDLVVKVPVMEDVYRVLVGGRSEVMGFFIRRFQCAAEVTGPPAAAGSAPGKVYEKRLLGGPLVSVWRDDLTRQDTDVVVNAANEFLCHSGGLAYALVKAGGRQIVQESNDIVSQRGILSAGDIAVTGAGTLPSKKMVHAVGPKWSQATPEKCQAKLQEAIRKVLDYVSAQADLHSVAIPAVSSGIFGFPLDLCATIIVTTVHTFCLGEAKGRLKEIRLVNNDDKTVQAMRAACERILGTSDNLSAATSSSRPALPSTYSASPSTYSASSSSLPALPSTYSASPSTYSAVPSTYSASPSTYSASPSTYSASPSPHSAQPTQRLQETSSHVAHSFTINGLNLHLKTGKIEDEKTQVIVNSVSSDLHLSSGGVSAAINRKAGYKLQDEIRRKRHQGNVMVTRGYNLHCQYVYHVILPGDKWEAEITLRQVTKQCLTTAHEHKCPSISFPALGTGNIGLERHKAADIMTQAVLDFARVNPSTMAVYFVIHPNDSLTFQAFQEKLRASGSDRNMESSAQRGGETGGPSDMCVTLSGAADDVGEAAAWLRGALSSPALLIHNKHLLLFGGEEFDALASGPPRAEVEEDLRDGRVALKISGPGPDRVMAAVQAERLLLDVQDELAEALAEELLEAAVIWFYEGPSESHRYPANANREVENARATRTTVTLRAPPGHVIDATSLTAHGRQRIFHLRRRCLGDALNIQTPEERPSLTKMVEPNSQEFRDRSNEFKKAGLTLLKMEKVRNKLLSGVFQSKKEAAEKRQKKPSTEQLYHLVPRQFCKKICDVGFHSMYSTPTDPTHGAGVYFKKSLHNIAQRFHSPGADGLLCILQAEVVIGAATRYARNQPLLPCVGPDALQVYDSLVDEGNSAEHYTIFDRFQANPQYVFTCRRKE